MPTATHRQRIASRLPLQLRVIAHHLLTTSSLLCGRCTLTTPLSSEWDMEVWREMKNVQVFLDPTDFVRRLHLDRIAEKEVFA